MFRLGNKEGMAQILHNVGVTTWGHTLCEDINNQCWARATFFRSRHRDVCHLLNHFYSLISATVAPRHI